MNPLYRRTYMRTFTDAMAEGFSTIDARALAEMEAREAVERENAREPDTEDSPTPTHSRELVSAQ